MAPSLFYTDMDKLNASIIFGHFLQSGKVPASADWPQLLRSARRFDVLALLHQRSRDWVHPVELPQPVEHILQRAHYVAQAQYSMRIEVLTQVLQAFEEQGISVLLLKGMALAHTVYPDPALRSMGDFDLLVSAEDVAQARKTLEHLGGVYKPEPPQRINPFNTGFTGEQSFHLTEGKSTMLVELHWELFTIEWFRRTTQLDLRALWERAVPLRIGEVMVWALAPEDQLLHVCLHLSMHGFTHLRGYVDVVQLLEREQIDWTLFLERALESRLNIACYLPLWWLAEYWNVSIPEDVLTTLRPDPLRVWFGRWIVSRGLQREPDLEHTWNHLAQMLVIQRYVDLLSVLAWLFFPGVAWLKARYRLQKRWQAWLWVVIHPLIVLWEGLRSLGQLSWSSLARLRNGFMPNENMKGEKVSL